MNTQQAFINGFCKRAAANGINGEELLKIAKPAKRKEEGSSMLPGMLGAGAGAGLGALGALKGPELMAKLKDLMHNTSPSPMPAQNLGQTSNEFQDYIKSLGTEAGALPGVAAGEIRPPAIQGLEDSIMKGIPHAGAMDKAKGMGTDLMAKIQELLGNAPEAQTFAQQGLPPSMMQ